MIDASKILGGIEDEGCRRSEEFAGFAGDDGAVGKFDGSTRLAALLLTLLGSHGDAAVIGGYLGLLEEQLYLLHLGLVVGTVGELVGSIVVAADYLVLGSLAAGFVVADTEAYHIDTHVGGRLVGILSVYALEKCIEDGEYLDVAVVVDGNLIIGLEVEGVNHVDIVEVGSGCLVGDVDGVLQRERPYGEGLKFGIAGLDAALVLIVELREADGHLAAARTRSRDDDERT